MQGCVQVVYAPVRSSSDFGSPPTFILVLPRLLVWQRAQTPIQVNISDADSARFEDLMIPVYSEPASTENSEQLLQRPD